jgi:hypothetical protein
LIAVLMGEHKTVTQASPRATAPAETKHAEEPPKDRALRDQLANAQASFDKGDYAGAIAQMTAIEAAHTDRADVHRLLERAYAASGDLASALPEAELWLKADPDAATDAKLGEDLHNAALGEGTSRPSPGRGRHQDTSGRGQRQDDAEAAFALLETSMGRAGADILYDIAYGGARKPAANRARAALASPAVRAHASPALAVALDLRGANTCEGKKAFLARAREDGDARTLALVRSYQPTEGCGFFGLQDCWTCMRRDGALASTIDALEARSAKP